MNDLINGKLFIKYIKHQMHFCFRPYYNHTNYYKYLVSESKKGFRQTPLVSLRLIIVMKLLFANNYDLKRMKVSITNHEMPVHKTIRNVLNFTNSTNQQGRYSEFIEKLEKLDNQDSIEIHLAYFTKKDSVVILHNNGIISVDKNHYNEITKKITKLLQEAER